MFTSPDGLDAGREALWRFLVGDDDLDGMLTKVALIATEVVPGCDVASVTMIKEGRPTTPVFTDKVALDLDRVQYDLGDGPCLAAARHRGVEHLSVGSDDRWPQFDAAARAEAVTAVLSAPLVNGEVVSGALNLYSRTVAGFDDDGREVASLFADQLGVAAATVTVYAEGFQLAEHLRRAMESRAVIEQAKGILMAAQRCGPDEAFEVLRRASQNQNRKLRAIAVDIVDRYTRGEAPASYESSDGPHT